MDDGVEPDPLTTGDRPTRLLPTTQLARISAYWLGLTAIDTAVSLYIAFQLTFSTMRGALPLGTASFLVSLGATVVAILVQPTAGGISDYAVTKWGRRKPFIVVGSLLDLVFLFAVASANTLLALAVAVMLLQFSTNLARGPFQGYVPDLVAEPQVGMASAMVGMMQIVGNVVGYALISAAAIFASRPLAIGAVAVIELVTMASVVLKVDKGPPAKPREGKSWRTIALQVWGTDILRERSFVWLVASRFFFLLVSSILFSYVAAYLRYTFGYSESGAGAVNLEMLVVVIIGNFLAVLPASRLSDRVGRKPLIYAACLIGAVGVVIVAAAPSVPIAIAGAGLFGVSQGIFLSVDWALMTDIIPRASAGRYMGISNVATGSANLAGVLVGGLVYDLTNAWVGTPDAPVAPRAAFLVGALMFGVAAWFLRPVVEPRRGRRGATPAAETATGV